MDPIVSIIMPVKNEIRAIGKCIEGFRAQTFPLAEFEIVIADGSTDGTRDILRGYEEDVPGWLRVFDNPTGRIAEGYNIALRNARGKIVNGYVGHAFPAPDYIESVVKVLMEDDTDMVGGRVIPLPATGTLVARAIATSLQSPFTVGRNAFTRDSQSTTTSTHWMAVKRTMIDRVGEFNEDFARLEDCDWYERMIEAGARAVFDPRVRSFYFPRDTLRGQFAAQVHNGANRMKLFLATGRGMRFRHVLPLLLPLCWCGAGAFAFGFFPAVMSGGLVYAALLAGVSARIAGSGVGLWFCVLVATFLVHLGHCLGLIAGAVGCGAHSIMKMFRP
ncbi:MAG: glycosyltransferase [Bacteroidetes bacterium]|nr:glycosyltransferase [Bacteroidota bacterium]